MVDDDEMTLAGVVDALEGVDAVIRTARSGVDALRLAMADEGLAAIVVDVSMPGMGGFELTALLRQRVCLGRTPVLFMTGVALRSEEVARGYELGAVDYLFKPVDLRVLRAKVSAFLLLYEGREDEPSPSATTAQLRLVDDESEHRAQLRRELAELRAALGECDRLAALGLNAATLAHEISSPLMGMMLHVNMLEHRLAGRGADAPEHRHIRVLTRELERLGALVSDFRSFGSGRELELEPLSIVEVVDACLELLGPTCEAQGVTVEQRMGADAPMVLGDRKRLTQVVLNLCSNAVEAMSEGGTLTLSSTWSGFELSLEISDTGPGLPEGVDVFAPFVTTKSTGTGLGLAIVREIVDAHGGRLEWRSEPGVGSSFLVVLPLEHLRH